MNDERRVVRDGGSVRDPATFHLADGKDAESLRRRPATGKTVLMGRSPKGRLDRAESMGI
jgi:hypothetical protein